MSRHQAPQESSSQRQLEALYRDHSDIEPDPGLDRMIRARAEQSLEAPRRHRPTPWIAGLATAGALALAVGISLQQAPSPVPEMGRSAPPASMLGDEPASALRSAPMPEPPAPRPQAEAARAAPDVAESAFVAELADTAPERAARQLQTIHEMLVAGQDEAARAALEHLLADMPELEVPEELRRLLDTPPQ